MTFSKFNFTVITAGGTGQRMGYDIPKQFIELSGSPILMHTIKRFSQFDKTSKIIVSLPAEQIEHWQNLCRKHNFNIKHQTVKGGENRFESVKNALKLTSGNGLTAIHDGVRPFVGNETLQRCFETAKKLGNAIAVQDITFSLRKITNSGSISQNRTLFKEVQTPQVFETDKIKAAYNQEFFNNFTDDASVFEKAGFEINIVKGNRENIKLTSPFDLITAKAILGQNKLFNDIMIQ